MAKREGKSKIPEHGRTTLAAARNATKDLGPLERNAVLKGTSRYLHAKKGQAAMARAAQTGYGGGGGGLAGMSMSSDNSIAYGAPQWYNPLIGSSDKYYFPASQERQNTIWRTYYELDPIIGSATDLFSDLPWSEFSLSGIEDKTILHTYEDCLNKLNLPTLLPAMTRELMMKGKVIPHLIFSDKLGYWVHCSVHDPSYVGVQGRGVVGVPPLLDLVPTPEMQWMAKSTDTRMVSFRRKLPPNLIDRILSGQTIPLSDLNATYIARKTCVYDTMGTSLYTRLFQVKMYEDCALFHTPITISDGTVRPVGEIRIGDMVLNRFGSVETVTNWVEKDSGGTLRWIRTKGGMEFKCTPTHKWPVVDAKDLPLAETSLDLGKIQKLEAKDIQAGSYLMVPRTFDEVPTQETPGFARLLGYFISEGCRRVINAHRAYPSTLGINFSFGLHEKDTWAEDTQDLCLELGVPTSMYLNEGRKSCVVSIQKKSGEWLAEKLIRLGGEGSSARFLAPEVMSWPVELKKELLCGYLRGDGSQTRPDQKYNICAIRAMTTSEQLAHQLFLLSVQVGWPCSKSTSIHNGSDGKHRQPQQWIKYGGSTAREIMAEVFGAPFEWTSRVDREFPMDDHFVYYKIKSIEDIQSDEKVYGITVSGDHSYLMSGVGTYNSLWNAALAVARRNAVPLRVFKLGDPASGWFPSQEDYDTFLAQLEQAELDPAAVLIYHFGLDVEYVGVSDKFLKISDESDFLRTLKLSALGVPESILGGEAVFSNADAGLQVMIERLAALRLKFMREWIMPKILTPIALANEFYQTTAMDALHRIRRGIPIKTEDDLVIPTLRWNKSLEVRDSFLMEVYKDLMERGFVSNKSYASIAGGIDLSSEVENLAEDKRLRDRAREILGDETQPTEAKRAARLLSGVVDLLSTGKTKTVELKHLSGKSPDVISGELEKLGIRDAPLLVNRIGEAVVRGEKRRAQIQDPVLTSMPKQNLWAGV